MRFAEIRITFAQCGQFGAFRLGHFLGLDLRLAGLQSTRQIEFWGVDARSALDHGPDRFKLDLPRGLKPGKAQIEAEEMAKAEGAELAALRERDPNFGKPQGIQP